jgi:long-chain acyl-CoA synthetase
MGARTLFDVLDEAARLHGDAPALHQPYHENGSRKYHTLTWHQYKAAALEIAAGLRAWGVEKGDAVALISETRMEFYLADLGILTNGSIAAALYTNYPPREALKTLEAVSPKAVFVEDPKTLGALQHFAGKPVWILLTGEADGAITLSQLREWGRKAVDADPELPERIHAGVRPEDPAILYLTSGATGEPKMVMVTHQAVVANLDMGPHVLPIGPEDATVAFLPSAHIAQRVVMELLPIRMGMAVTFSESLLKLPQDIKAVRPTVFLAPPRLWERIYSTICTELNKKPAPVRKLFYGALGLGLTAADLRRQGKPVPAHIRWPLSLADRVVFKQIRARFGGRLKIAASGAAPLSKDLAQFYEAVGMPLVEGYGLTEGGVVTFNPIDRPKPGSIGKALPGVELKVAPDGELLIRTPCLFTGYYRDPATTREVLRDGWLHTGDIASIDAEGYVFITGRKKELIVSSTGKKIFPARVEGMFKLEPLISQVFLVGDRLPYLTALFTINRNVADSLKRPVTEEVQKLVLRINKQLAPFEQVRKYRVLERDFSIEHGELTATMKVRRTRVLENFHADIQELYRGKEG